MIKTNEAGFSTSVKIASRVAFLRRWVLTVWTLLVLCSFAWNVHMVRESMHQVAYHQAQALYEKDILYRSWNAMHGGVYVPVTPDTPPNPYLEKLQIPDQQVTTPSGRLLTLMNPAYMTRQVLELQEKKLNVKGHLSSLKPVNPKNIPDAWERSSLATFENGSTTGSVTENIDGKPYLRVIYPFITEQPCLKCHAAQGYKVGDIRGGISVSVPLEPFLKVQNSRITHLCLSHFGIWLMGVLGALFGFVHYRNSELKRVAAEEDLKNEHLALHRSYAELQASLEKVKQLEGIIPICMYCKKIRDDQESWNNLESYISSHSSAEFSHGICPACFEKNFGEHKAKVKTSTDKD